MRKICVVITARTSYAKIKPVFHAIKKHPNLELQIICAASALLPRYGNIDGTIENDGFKINERIYMVVEGETLLTSAKSTGLGLMEFAAAYDRLKPNCVFVMADRYEQMAASVAAAYMNIPLAHAQGGEVSGNIDEKVRHAITKLADIHFPATQRAYNFITRMGEAKDKVFLSGCPSIDICKEVIEKPNLNFNVFEKYGGVGEKPDLSDDYIIVMQHPVTSEFGDAHIQTTQTLEAIKELKLPTLWFWPNIDAGSDETSKAIRTFREQHELKHIHFFKNMQPHDFLRILYRSRMIVGNSSVGIRESAALGVASVNIGSRQLNRERAENVIDVNHDKNNIITAIKTHLSRPPPKRSDAYGDGHAGMKIADILATVSLTSQKSLSYLNDSGVT